MQFDGVTTLWGYPFPLNSIQLGCNVSYLPKVLDLFLAGNKMHVLTGGVIDTFFPTIKHGIIVRLSIC